MKISFRKVGDSYVGCLRLSRRRIAWQSDKPRNSRRVALMDALDAADIMLGF